MLMNSSQMLVTRALAASTCRHSFLAQLLDSAADADSLGAWQGSGQLRSENGDANSDLETDTGKHQHQSQPAPQAQTDQPGQQFSSARAGTSVWYRERLLEPLFPSARVSVLVFLFIMLTMKRDRGLTDSVMDMSLCLIAKAVLPAGNLLPSPW